MEDEGTNPRPLKVLICAPLNGLVYAEFARSLARAMAYFAPMPYAGEKTVDFTYIHGTNSAEKRNFLVSRAYQLDATHILWVDPDIKFPPDAIPALLNHGKSVVAINYPTKEIQARPTAYAETDDYVGPVWSGDNAEGLQEVSHCGMGLMLCDVRVFEALELPYFHCEPAPPDFLTIVSEETYLCHKMTKAGIKIYIDHDLSKRCARIGDFEYTNNFAKQAEVTKQELYRGLDK